MPGQHVNVVTVGEPSSRPLSAVTMTSAADDEEEGDFVIDYSESYQGHQSFTDANLDPNLSQWAIQTQIDPSHALPQDNHRRGVPPGARPPLLHSQSLQMAPQRPQPVRYGSFPGPARSASPHLIGGDVFAAPGLAAGPSVTGSPVRRSQSAFGMHPPPLPTMNGATSGAHLRQTHDASFTQSQAHDLVSVVSNSETTSRCVDHISVLQPGPPRTDHSPKPTAGGGSFVSAWSHQSASPRHISYASSGSSSSTVDAILP